MIAPASITTAMSERLGVWSLSETTLLIGTDVYGDSQWLEQTKIKLEQARQRLDTLIQTAGLTVAGGTDLYRFVETEKAHELWEHLAGIAIYVRRFEKLPQYLRIGLPSDSAEESRLAEAVQNYQ